MDTNSVSLRVHRLPRGLFLESHPRRVGSTLVITVLKPFSPLWGPRAGGHTLARDLVGVLMAPPG